MKQFASSAVEFAKIATARMRRRIHCSDEILSARNSESDVTAAIAAHQPITVKESWPHDAGDVLIEIACECGLSFYLRAGYESHKERNTPKPDRLRSRVARLYNEAERICELSRTDVDYNVLSRASEILQAIRMFRKELDFRHPTDDRAITSTDDMVRVSEIIKRGTGCL